MGNSYINYNSNVRCKEEITIGDGCAISWGFEILDDDSHELKIGGEKVKSSRPINIRDNVWIGHNSTVQKGVTINENSVVASNSVVTTDVPANTLVAGCPTEIKHENVNWE
jgi:acetyltransferase-like isoleucine patch superfamily enzyme